MNVRRTSKISVTEFLTLALLAVSLAVAFILVLTDVPSFERFTVEDGVVEWVTVLGLLLASVTCFIRAFTLYKVKSRLFTIAAFLFGLVLFFGAGEEISWGQRILGIQSSEYFQKNNSQGETNFHNLVLGGVQINLWIFSFLLSFFLAVYVIVIPWLYRTKAWMRNFIDYCGIPLPKLYQIIAFLLLFALTQLIPHGKRAEMLELGTGLLFFLIIRYPSNRQTFEK